MPIEISYLADHTEWLANVSRWYEDEWSSLWEPDSFSGWFDVAMAQANYSALPLAFVAHQQGKLLGVAGLDFEAYPPEMHRFGGPWMTGLFAEKNERSSDVKILLARQILETAKYFGYSRVLTMCRVKAAAYNYEGRSWRQEEHLVLSGREIFVLSMDLCGDEA